MRMNHTVNGIKLRRSRQSPKNGEWCGWISHIPLRFIPARGYLGRTTLGWRVTDRYRNDFLVSSNVVPGCGYFNDAALNCYGFTTLAKAVVTALGTLPNEAFNSMRHETLELFGVTYTELIGTPLDEVFSGGPS